MAAPDLTARPLLVLGELCADIVVDLDAPPVFGQSEHLVTSTSVVMGSSSAITACGAARMGVPTAIVGVVGDDLLGGFVLDELKRRGVDVSGCRVDPTLPTGTSTILSLPGGDRSILTALGSIGTVTPDDVPDALAEASGHLHVGSYFLQYALHDTLAGLFEQWRAAGRSTSLDPNFDPAETWDSAIAAVLPHTDVLFCNEQEATSIARCGSVAEAVWRLVAMLPPGAELVVKRGSLGASVYVGDGRSVMEEANVSPGPTDAPLVDTVGAGDSLAAGYLAARLRGCSLEERLAVGVRNGTASTRAAGGTAGQLDWPTATPHPH